MMDPEMVRLAQEQMSRIPPAELLRMQQQMMSNPDFLRLATEGMKNMRPEDLRFAAEQMRNMPPEQIADMSSRMANVSPAQLAAMNATRDYAFQAALVLKNQGNELHGAGRFHEAIEKYLKGKENLVGLTTTEALNLKKTCSLNLMSCYLKTSEYKKVLQEGSEVLSSDPKNLKALYRRGQAYKELNQLRLAVADLSEAAAIDPNDETVANELQKVRDELERQGDDGPIIEEITEEEAERLMREASTSAENTSTSPVHDQVPSADVINSLKQNPDLLRNMQTMMTTMNPEEIAAMSGGQMTPEMAKAASDLMKYMTPSDLEKMLQVATNMREAGGLNIPSSSAVPTRPPSAPSISNPMQNLIDPAMKEMLNTMVKNMTPEQMASMSQQLGFNMTPDQAADAHRALTNLSPDQLDKLMVWAQRAQTVTEQARKAKAWLLGRQGLIFAIIMLLIAFVLHYFGFVGR